MENIVEVKNLLLAGLSPVVWQVVEWLKAMPYVGKVPPALLALVTSSAFVLSFFALPQGTQDTLLTVAIPMGAAALLHEGRKMVRGVLGEDA